MTAPSVQQEGGSAPLDDHVEQWQRFVDGRHCPNCGKSERAPRHRNLRCSGYVSKDLKSVWCSQDDGGGLVPTSGDKTLYRHRLGMVCECGTRHPPIRPQAWKEGKVSLNGTGKKKPRAAPPPPKLTYEKVGPVQRWTIRDREGRGIAVHARQNIVWEDGAPDKFMWWEHPDGRRSRADTDPLLVGPSEMLYGAELLTPGCKAVEVEGEKACDALRPIAAVHGWVVVATVNGAPKPLGPGVLDLLATCSQVMGWADNAPDGRQQVESIAEGLTARGAAFHRITWPDAPERGDAADWVAQYGPEPYSKANAYADLGLMLWMASRQPESGAALLDAVTAYMRRFVVLPTPEALHAVVLWVMHTWLLDTTDYTPYLRVESAEKESGKTRVLEVVEGLVWSPRSWLGMTPATVFRIIERGQPTILIDETDHVWKGKSENSDLTAILNAGFQRGKTVPRMVGEGSKMDVHEFPVFCPKALAGIGKLPDTIRSRSIVIKVKRRSASEGVEKFRPRKLKAETEALQARIKAWADWARASLAGAEPAMPESIRDRAADVWEPLVAIADAAGGEWPAWARKAATHFGGNDAEDDGSWGVLVLADIRLAFQLLERDLRFTERPRDRISSKELAERLAGMEGRPWPQMPPDGKPLDDNGLAKLLKRYEIKPHTVRLGFGRGSATAKGYVDIDFTDAWSRYLRDQPVREMPEPEEGEERDGGPRYCPECGGLAAIKEGRHFCRRCKEFL